ncbi:ketopantoate hydroxymethyltransferase [Paenibacillus oralis]|uniref:Ketopantoate hydroxymethyltransferase n=1 Tax=Paenibacillus oralis TaxID=2490856 RepID=A0A3P3TWA2_9BACL|nr:ketopantoate hydroxymethyltransferase [Paenibacillus oralis]RRJ62392.1 ketopantoate hydroxymethyltransferase [Paenibacillus oralis]
MIATEFLHDVAEYVDTRVAKVVLNNTYEITNFDQKAVTDSTLAINYVVPAVDISLITQIELRDASNKVITSNAVNVPVPSDTLMLQTIEVKEVND